jgi:hypothetical protein
MKKSTISMLVILLLVTMSLNALAQAEVSQPNVLPYKTPNSILYGSDVIIDDQPTQDQRNTCLSVAYNGWLYTCISVNEGGAWRWKIFLSTDDGSTWTILRDTQLGANWYVASIDIVVTGNAIANLKIFVSRILNNSSTGNSELIVSQLDGNTGYTLLTLWENIASGGEIFRDVDIASDYRFPAVGAVPFSIAVLYSKSIAAVDSIVLLTSSNGGTSIDGYQTVCTTGSYTRNVSLAYGSCENFFNGRYFAAWEARTSSVADLGRIFTAHTTTYFDSPFTTPFGLDNLLTSTENFARNPSIACQFNNTDNDMLNLTEIVLFDRAYNGTLTDFDVVGCFNKEAANTDNWGVFGLDASYTTSDIQPKINFDPGYNNFLATYFNSTNQKLRFLGKYMNMIDPYNWVLISDKYNDAINLMNPYPQIEINPVYLQVAHVWNGEGIGGGVATFDAEYSHVGIKEEPPAGVSVAVSPNPAASRATFRIDLKETSQLTIQLFSLQGKEMMQVAAGNYSTGVHSFVADVSMLPEGCYLYRVAAGDKTGTGRLIVKK